ncbi:thermonuclease family protein [Brenneria tiliae]|uniref:Thermonuclease family protein n=1 Tax=Brenneria tiliae TaxID=2914984 RepID=A0ABT0MSS5_9GAMM|nr:thermonuclease family protein [Brenneria tiliae]MCL2892249.1 thermonuclease family protein [Brenneria tiliae]MCL2897895.1 thermonuclease family protein [Brenneria tiliae]MCL2902492.1 thermonuclease family protein [Brenneria tiliae]
MKSYLLAAILLFSAPAPAATLSGKVVKVVDGDTLLVRRNGADYRIRMLGIDAPEYRQPYGKESRRALDRRVGGKRVTIWYEEKDRYGRYLGTVYYRNNNINLELLRNGQAWVYRDYRNDRELMSRENAARRQRLGLWRTPDPQAPWAYRRTR